MQSNSIARLNFADLHQQLFLDKFSLDKFPC